MSYDMIGREGRVTGTVGPGRTGEVIVDIRGGSERFPAHPRDGETVIAKNTRVIVVGIMQGRSVLVETLDH